MYFTLGGGPGKLSLSFNPEDQGPGDPECNLQGESHRLQAGIRPGCWTLQVGHDEGRLLGAFKVWGSGQAGTPLIRSRAVLDSLVPRCLK